MNPGPDTNTNAASQPQQDEIDYLLKNHDAILNKTEENAAVKTALSLLKENRASHFQILEEILDQLNISIIKARIEKSPNATILNCGECFLTRFPRVMLDLPELKGVKTLFLYHNNLTRLPVEFGKLNELETLDLSHNQLTALPVEMGILPLKLLFLDYNKFTVLPVIKEEVLLVTNEKDAQGQIRSFRLTSKADLLATQNRARPQIPAQVQVQVQVQVQAQAQAQAVPAAPVKEKKTEWKKLIKRGELIESVEIDDDEVTIVLHEAYDNQKNYLTINKVLSNMYKDSPLFQTKFKKPFMTNKEICLTLQEGHGYNGPDDVLAALRVFADPKHIKKKNSVKINEKKEEPKVVAKKAQGEIPAPTPQANVNHDDLFSDGIFGNDFNDLNVSQLLNDSPRELMFGQQRIPSFDSLFDFEADTKTGKESPASKNHKTNRSF